MDLFRVLEVMGDGMGIPCDGCLFVSVGVAIAFRLATLMAEETEAYIYWHIWPRLSVFANNSPIEIGSDFVTLVSPDGMTVRTGRLEEVTPFHGVTLRV
jgi:hypothetical protein